MGVQAEDAAGNQVKKVIRFEIRPGKKYRAEDMEAC